MCGFPTSFIPAIIKVELYTSRASTLGISYHHRLHTCLDYISHCHYRYNYPPVWIFHILYHQPQLQLDALSLPLLSLTCTGRLVSSLDLDESYAIWQAVKIISMKVHYRPSLMSRSEHFYCVKWNGPLYI